MDTVASSRIGEEGLGLLFGRQGGQAGASTYLQYCTVVYDMYERTVRRTCVEIECPMYVHNVSQGSCFWIVWLSLHAFVGRQLLTSKN